jgi:hypothetical protein
VTASPTTGSVVLSLPQAIATSSAVTFDSLTLGHSGIGNVVNVTGATAFNSVQTTGGFNADSGGGSAGAYAVGGTVVINSQKQFVGAVVTSLASSFGAITVTSCSGCTSATGVTSAAGSPNQVAVNGDFTGGTHTGAITLALPQGICNSCNVIFNQLTLASNLAGSTASFGINSGTAVSAPNTSAANSFSTAGGYTSNAFGASVNAFTVNGTGVINSTGQYTGAINTSAASTFGASVTFNGGLQTNFATNSVLYVGSGGNFYNRTVSNSGGISCGSITDGWTAATSDGFIVVCLGGARFRAALSSF